MRIRSLMTTMGLALALAGAGAALHPSLLYQSQSDFSARIGSLRELSDSDRARETMALALEIRKLPAGKKRFNYAFGLSHLATEGDFGRDTLQAVTDTLADSLDGASGQMASAAYSELAQLSRLEGMKVTVKSPGYKKALAELDAIEAQRAKANFTLTDLNGHTWTRSTLKGKIVLVNFWATWCPPCRKEMPDLDALYSQYKSKGLVILAISDENDATVRKFINDQGYKYPVMLDPGRKVNELYKVEGIPKSFIYDRKGHLAAETIDMRTRGQFLALLAKAGLK